MNSLIGVHCTHGLNRTGYMVCRYMRDRLGIPATEAIKRFEDARGYKIERENYIADLLGRTPPPPDFGQDTIVKPIVRDVEYCSPLKDYCDEEDDERESRKRRFGNHSSYGSKRYNANRDDLSIKRSKRNKNRDSSPENFSPTYRYDFRYDY